MGSGSQTGKIPFAIAKDINVDNAWFIYNSETYIILNDGDINDDEYKKLFVQTGGDNSLKSTFNSLEDVERVFQNLSKIYIDSKEN